MPKCIQMGPLGKHIGPSDQYFPSNDFLPPSTYAVMRPTLQWLSRLPFIIGSLTGRPYEDETVQQNSFPVLKSTLWKTWWSMKTQGILLIPGLHPEPLKAVLRVFT